MYNLRTELIKSILSSLKIDDNPFNQQIIKDKIEHLQDNQLQDFYGKLFDASHQYLNGIDRVAKVAETFKPIVSNVDEDLIKAKELIKLVEGMNDSVYRDSEHMEVTFDDLLEVVQFPTVCKDDLAILANVPPHYDVKLLVKNINTYQTSVEQIKAFKVAINKPTQTALSNDVRKMIKGN
jgi:hypothetical protein